MHKLKIPDNISPETLDAEGSRCLRMELYDQALAIFEHLCRLQPANPKAHYQRGLTLYAQGDLRAATNAYKTAIKYAPKHPGIFLGLGNCYYALGERDKATASYEAALALKPDFISCMYSLVLTNNYHRGSPVIEKLHSLHQSHALSNEDRAIVCFALGTFYEQQKKLPEAFPYYAEGNQLQYKAFNYDPSMHINYMDKIENYFSAELLDALKGKGSNDATPIFILGMPRSGTSLVEQVLASHPYVRGAGELNKFAEVATGLIPRLSGKTFPHGLDNVTQHFEKLANHYVEGLRAHGSGKYSHICDKMPTNFLYIGLIYLLFPKARIIHCVRDPMDTCWSCYKQLFFDRHLYTYDQVVLGKFYMRYHQLMKHWHRVLPGFIYDIHYEKLVNTPEETVREMLEFCNLEWDSACLSFYKNKRAVTTASTMQVRRPIYKTALKSWQSIEADLQPLRQQLADCYSINAA